MSASKIDKGSLVGRYHVLEELGAGAMGVVYAAYDPDLDRKVALKVLRPRADRAGDVAKSEQRLQREAKAIAKLSHPNVVAIHDVGVFEGQVFLAMEFLGGGTLRDWMDEKRRSWQEVVKIFIEVGRGLAAAHAAGLIHRDFKPENVLLDGAGRPRVGDFGLARMGAADGDIERSNDAPPMVQEPDTRLTRTGALMGTPAYMAPEQFLGQRIDARTDQFSFCVALFEALYGERPFKGDTMLALAASVSDGTIISISPSAAPPWLRRIVVQGLSTTPSDRFNSMDEVLAALADDPALKRRRLAITSLVSLVVIATIAGAWQATTRKRRQLDAEIAGRLVEGEKSLQAARSTLPALNQLRAAAFAKFEGMKRNEGERIWQEALSVSATLDGAYQAAERSFDGAFALDRSRTSVRDRLAATLFDRAALAEREGRRSDLDRHLRRLADLGDQALGRWKQSGSISVETDPPGLTLALERYREERSGARVPVLERQGLVSPLRGLQLEPGSYRLVARSPGRTHVAYPFIVTRGHHANHSFRVPATSEIPKGFVYVPAGPFQFGEADESMRLSFLDAVPIHESATTSFLIAKYETTFAEFIRFLDALSSDQRARRSPLTLNSSEGMFHGAIELTKGATGRWHLVLRPAAGHLSADEGEPIVFSGRNRRKAQNWSALPVVGVSPVDAQAYVNWLDASGRLKGARLCTEKEWERAARGADDRIFPHGDWLAEDDANIDVTYGRIPLAFGPDEIGSHPNSVSPFGVFDLTGNVFEITASVLEKDGFVARGGGYYHDRKTARATNRAALEPTTRLHTFGLRVCATAL